MHNMQSIVKPETVKASLGTMLCESLNGLRRICKVGQYFAGMQALGSNVVRGVCAESVTMSTRPGCQRRKSCCERGLCRICYYGYIARMPAKEVML